MSELVKALRDAYEETDVIYIYLRTIIKDAADTIDRLTAENADLLQKTQRLTERLAAAVDDIYSMRNDLPTAVDCYYCAHYTPAGKIGDYVEWDTGVSVRLFQIQGILIEPDGVRYDLGDLAPFVNHKNINRILTRAAAEQAKGERE